MAEMRTMTLRSVSGETIWSGQATSMADAVQRAGEAGAFTSFTLEQQRGAPDAERLALEPERHVLGSVEWPSDGEMFRVCSCTARFEVWLTPQRDGSYRLLPEVCPVAEAERELAAVRVRCGVGLEAKA